MGCTAGFLMWKSAPSEVALSLKEEVDDDEEEEEGDGRGEEEEEDDAGLTLQSKDWIGLVESCFKAELLLARVRRC